MHFYPKSMYLLVLFVGEGNIAMAELGIGQTHTVPLVDKKGGEAGEIKFWAKVCSCQLSCSVHAQHLLS